MMIYEAYTLSGKIKRKKTTISFFVCCHCKKKSDIFFAIVGLVSLLSVTTNLHIICKTLTLTYRKTKYKTHPRYIVIIERFHKRSNVMQMLLCNNEIFILN